MRRASAVFVTVVIAAGAMAPAAAAEDVFSIEQLIKGGNDGAAARTRVLDADAFPTAAAIAAVLIDNAIPATAGDDRQREEVSS
ncbi:hypothetical protein AB0O64_26685 [Streptomyces sp. NPDC088341]|uniref:hypothetical protein n=1 Tax=Streptomyces sp. NPDC088341 TaxID=3154870 RepID=UPI0034245DCB